MIYPWMFDLDPVLRPLRAAADVLAAREDWPALYDAARLAANDVPVAAAVYFHDMYVPRELSLPTTDAIGALRAWVTSEYEHDGLRVSNGVVLDRLVALARGLALSSAAPGAPGQRYPSRTVPAARARATPD
jgi:hypothetical protein